MAVSEKDFVNVESGTDETYVALDQEVEVYDVEEAIDDINGIVLNGDLEKKVDYLADTKDMIRQAIINKGQPVEETASFRSYAESIGELTGEINNQDVLITENGTYEAESGYTGLGEVTVEVQPTLQDKVITQNGTYRADTGYDGLGNVVVNTPVINNQDKTITENGVYTADSGYSGLGEITVEVPQPEPTLDTLTATTNGNYTPPAGIDGYDEVVVNVQPDLQNKTITTNGTYTADSGYDGLGEIVVDVPAPQPVLETLNVTANGTYTPPANVDGYDEVVVNVADTPAVIDPLSITPSTSQQVITAPSGVDGYSPITVGAVTSAIDSNIVAENIKDGVTILGVQGTCVAPKYYVQKSVDSNGVLGNSGQSLIDFDGVLTVDYYALNFAYYRATFPANTVINMGSVKKILDFGCQNAFWGASNIVSANLGAVEEVGRDGCENMFGYSGNLTTADLGQVKTIQNGAFTGMFSGCGNLISVNVGSVENAAYDCFTSMFYHCEKLPTVVWSSLNKMDRGGNCFSRTFERCSLLQSLFFPALNGSSFGTLTNQFYSMLNECSGVAVHFPSNLQAVIGSWSDVQNGFGGTNTTVLFDLPATVTLVGTNSYERNPKYDTANSLAWFDTSATRATPYYTNGTTDPTVGDYIYSDATCTTQVDTIASIS